MMAHTDPAVIKESECEGVLWMNVTTLFNAYRHCRDNMESLVDIREKGLWGIAIDQDYVAIKWQKNNTLARKIEYRINGENFCPICGYPRWHGHLHTCPRYEEI